MTYIPREISSVFYKAMETLPIVALTGMRQTGKSTFLLHDPIFRGFEFETLDDLETLDAARQDPEGFIAGRGKLIIDEVQRSPELFLALKVEVDRNRKPGRFILSGSARFSLMKQISETLAGRALYLTLNPMTRHELSRQGKDRSFLAEFLQNPDLVFNFSGFSRKVSREEIRRGGFPPVTADTLPHSEYWFKGYEQTYIERDIRRFSNISDMSSFRKLLQMCALRTGQILNRSELARDAGLKVDTATRYLSVMEASFVITILTPYRTNRTTRLIKSPKIYLSDSGFASHLAGFAERGTVFPGVIEGALFETYVLHNLQGLLAAFRPDAVLSFWNVQGRHEVDFIIETGGQVIAVEVKHSARWGDSDFSGLRAFLEREPRCGHAILAFNGRGAHPIRISEKIMAVPISVLLS